MRERFLSEFGSSFIKEARVNEGVCSMSMRCFHAYRSTLKVSSPGRRGPWRQVQHAKVWTRKFGRSPHLSCKTTGKTGEGLELREVIANADFFCCLLGNESSSPISVRLSSTWQPHRILQVPENV